VIERIGFMQGRLSSLVDGRIQAFPWTSWQQEFPLAEAHGFRLMEWTLDQEGLYDNPLMTAAGRAEIRLLCRRHGLGIPSLTGDCFMHAPLWKAQGEERTALMRDFKSVAQACAEAGISMILLPLVDNGSLECREQEDVLVNFIRDQGTFLSQSGLKVIFESDFEPAELARFIARLDQSVSGINYDIGNSAALGFDPSEELAAYGHRVVNVHVKDRILGGTTVALGTGNADFDSVFSAIAQLDYSGNYILQTARAVDGNHASVLCRYRDMTMEWLNDHAA
jgi:hexulose-6-phosphate isomerase